MRVICLFNLFSITSALLIPRQKSSFKLSLASTTPEETEKNAEVFAAPSTTPAEEDLGDVDFDALSKESADNAFKTKRDISDMYVNLLSLHLSNSLSQIN